MVLRRKIWGFFYLRSYETNVWINNYKNNCKKNLMIIWRIFFEELKHWQLNIFLRTDLTSVKIFISLKTDNKVIIKIIFTQGNLFTVHIYALNKNLDFAFNKKKNPEWCRKNAYTCNKVPGTGDLICDERNSLQPVLK